MRISQSVWNEWSGPSLAESTRIMVCHEWKQAHWFFISANISNVVRMLVELIGWWEEPDFFAPDETVEISVISLYWCDWKAHFWQHTSVPKLFGDESIDVTLSDPRINIDAFLLLNWIWVKYISHTFRESPFSRWSKIGVGRPTARTNKKTNNWMLGFRLITFGISRCH